MPAIQLFTLQQCIELISEMSSEGIYGMDRATRAGQRYQEYILSPEAVQQLPDIHDPELLAEYIAQSFKNLLPQVTGAWNISIGYNRRNQLAMFIYDVPCDLSRALSREAFSHHMRARFASGEVVPVVSFEPDKAASSDARPHDATVVVPTMQVPTHVGYATRKITPVLDIGDLVQDAMTNQGLLAKPTNEIAGGDNDSTLIGHTVPNNLPGRH